MKKPAFKKGLIVLVVALLIAAIGAVSLLSSNRPGFITSAVETVLKPIKIAGAGVAGTCEKLYGYMHDYDRLMNENEALRAQVSGAGQELRELEALQAENERLRELLGLAQKNSDFVFESASLIAWSASSWDSSFTINKGSSNSNVKPGDAVITASGAIVGMVKTVSANSSSCISLIDTTFAASVLVDNVSGACSAVGDYTLMKQGLLKAEYLNDSNQVLAGDSVVSSGKGGVFPAGLLLGYAEEVCRSVDGLNDYIVISPAANLNDLLYVYIITDFSTSE